MSFILFDKLKVITMWIKKICLCVVVLFKIIPFDKLSFLRSAVKRERVFWLLIGQQHYAHELENTLIVDDFSISQQVSLFYDLIFPNLSRNLKI